MPLSKSLNCVIARCMSLSPCGSGSDSGPLVGRIQKVTIKMTKLEELVVVTSAWRGESSGQIYSEMGGESEFLQVELETEEEEDVIALAELHAVVDLRRLTGSGRN